MSKLIFSDLDGTLLCDDKSISTEDAGAIRKATALGHKFVVTTGRTFESARQVSEKLGLNTEGCYLISYNGGHIYDWRKKKELFQQTLPVDVVKELFDRAVKAGIYCQTYVDGKVASLHQTEEMEYYSSRAGLDTLADEHFLEKLTQEPNKVILIDLYQHEKLEQFLSEQMSWAKGKIDFVFSNRKYLEAMPCGVSKALGVRKLSGLLGVDIRDTIAVGDEQNDIPMIRAAGVGVAMKNAIPQAIEAADYVTKRTNNESAMTEILQKFVFEEET